MPYDISTEANVNNYPNTEFMAFYKEKLTTGIWRQASGVDSFYGFVANKNAKKCIVISQGRSESVIKYAELIFDLYRNGYSVFLFDHQGQGQSSRLLPNRDIGYVARFDDYVEDMHELMEKVLAPLLINQNQETLPKALLCHSMGGAIGGLYVQAYPKVFSKLILSAPMIGIDTPVGEQFTYWVVSTWRKLRKIVNLPNTYFAGQGDYQAYPFDTNKLTNSDIRYRVFREMMATHPQNRLGGISLNWFAESIIGMRRLRKKVSLIHIPTLVFQADQELIVDNTKMTKFANNLPNGKLIVMSNAKHELFFEKDEVRNDVLSELFAFLA